MSLGQITLYVATSVDGYIADEDGGVSWLDEFQQDAAGDGGYDEFFGTVDCLVVGARTYEQALSFGEWPYADRPTYVLTHGDHPRATDAVEFVEGDVGELAVRLTREYEHVWLVGGAKVVDSFLRADAVDELRLTLVPVLLGAGIALFPADGERRRLELLDTTTHGSGLVELRYRVNS